MTSRRLCAASQASHRSWPDSADVDQTDPCQSGPPPQAATVIGNGDEAAGWNDDSKLKQGSTGCGAFRHCRELSSGSLELGTQASEARSDQPDRPSRCASTALSAAGRRAKRPAALPAGWCAGQSMGPSPWRPPTPNRARSASTAAEQDARALLGLHHWALRRQAQQLHRHLREGGALLLVEPGDDAEERAACKALLRHASGGVQTHEIARPQT